MPAHIGEGLPVPTGKPPFCHRIWVWQQAVQWGRAGSGKPGGKPGGKTHGIHSSAQGLGKVVVAASAGGLPRCTTTLP